MSRTNPATSPHDAATGQTHFTAAVLRGGSVALETHPLPPRQPGEIDVAVSLAAICGSDLHTVSGRRSAPDGTGLGHEAVGRVVAVDAAAVDARGRPIALGDRVVFGMIASCGHCDRCRSGLSMKCRSLFKYGHATIAEPPHAIAMLADRIRLRPGVTVLRTPEHLDDAAVVSMACAVPTAAAGVRALGAPLPSRAVVVGAGAVGLYLVGMLVSAGVEVHIVEPNAARRTIACHLGAIASPAIPEGSPAILEASGSPDAVAAAVASAGIGARLVLLGSVSPGAACVPLDPATIVLRRLHLVGVHNYDTDDVLAALDWLSDHGASFPRLVGEPYDLDDIEVAFAAAFDGDTPRVAVRPRTEPARRAAGSALR